MADLSESVKGAKTLTEVYDAVMNAIGAEAWRHYETLLNAHEVRSRRAVEREMAPWSYFDVELLKRLQRAADDLNPTTKGGDPVKPSVRLADIIEQMAEVKLKAERGY